MVTLKNSASRLKFGGLGVYLEMTKDGEVWSCCVAGR